MMMAIFTQQTPPKGGSAGGLEVDTDLVCYGNKAKSPQRKAAAILDFLTGELDPSEILADNPRLVPQDVLNALVADF